MQTSCVKHVVVAHLYFVGLHQVLLNEVPFQLFNASLKLLVNLFFVFHVFQHEAFEHLFGEHQLAHLLLAIGAKVLQQFKIAVANQLFGDSLGYFRTEVGLVFHCAFAVNGVEKLLVYGCFDVTGNLQHMESKVRLNVGSLFFADTQHRRNLNFALRVGLLGVERHHLTAFHAVEQFLLVVNLYVFGHQHRTFFHDATFFLAAVGVQFLHVALQHVLCLVLFHLLVLAGTRCKHVYLFVYQLVVYGYFVVV